MGGLGSSKTLLTRHPEWAPLSPGAVVGQHLHGHMAAKEGASFAVTVMRGRREASSLPSSYGSVLSQHPRASSWAGHNGHSF